MGYAIAVTALTPHITEMVIKWGLAVGGMCHVHYTYIKIFLEYLANVFSGTIFNWFNFSRLKKNTKKREIDYHEKNWFYSIHFDEKT